tara:strand:- start:1157 stop:1435 length:279 start_codon:yes stop_codon:yes gene_type:complete
MKKILAITILAMLFCNISFTSISAAELTGKETISELLKKGFKIIKEDSNTSNNNMSMIKIFTLHNRQIDKLVICSVKIRSDGRIKQTRCLER